MMTNPFLKVLLVAGVVHRLPVPGLVPDHVIVIITIVVGIHHDGEVASGATVAGADPARAKVVTVDPQAVVGAEFPGHVIVIDVPEPKVGRLVVIGWITVEIDSDRRNWTKCTGKVPLSGIVRQVEGDHVTTLLVIERENATGTVDPAHRLSQNFLEAGIVLKSWTL